MDSALLYAADQFCLDIVVGLVVIRGSIPQILTRQFDGCHFARVDDKLLRKPQTRNFDDASRGGFAGNE